MRLSWLGWGWLALVCGGSWTLGCSDDASPAGGDTTTETTGSASSGGMTAGTSTGTAADETDSTDPTSAADTSTGNGSESGSTGSPGSSGSTGSTSTGGVDSTDSGSDSTGGFEVEGCGMCNAGEVCRANLAQMATYECVAIPERCEGEANCECAASLCEDPFVACSDPVQENSIECICIAC